MGKKKSKKSKKSKKQKEEVIIDDESDDGEVIDIDVGEEEDPVEDDVDDDYYMGKEAEENEGEDFEDKGEVEGEVATGEKKSLFKVPALSFTEAEMPLLGYAMASFVFFLAAVGKQCKFNFRRRTEDFAAGFLEDFFDEITDIAIDDDFQFGGANPFLGMYGGFGCLPTGYYAYAICLGIFGILMSVGLVVWMKLNDSIAAKRNAAEGDIEMDGESIPTEEDKSVSERFLDNHKWVFNGLLFLWAVIGWAIFTFGAQGVFSMTGNGKNDKERLKWSVGKLYGTGRLQG